MNAIIQNKYGGIEKLSLVNIEKPSIKDNQVLVKVKAVNIASGDMRINTFDVPFAFRFLFKIIFGWKGPRNNIRGITASGKIEQVGKNVKQYNINDEVYFINSMKAGCLADYIVLNEKTVMSIKPKNISFIDASPIAFGAQSALHFINETNVNNGDNILIYGASGSVGSYAVQLAKYYGATVTAVSSKKNHEVLLKLGADVVIDYHSTDINKLNVKYTVIFDAVGKISKKKVNNILCSRGKYLSITRPTKECKSRLDTLNRIIQEGKLITLIDSVYGITEFKEAHQKTYAGHKVGNVVIDWEK